MRITNNIVVRKYMSNLNKSKTALDKLVDRATTQQRYRDAYENPTSALKAFNVRRDLSKYAIYKENIVDVQNTMTDIESAISSLNDLAIDINAQLEQAKNPTYGETELRIIAEVLRGLQKQVLNVANASYSSKYLFGGTNVKTEPFTLDASGKLLYNGVDVDTGTFEKQSIYIDVGLGLTTGSLNANNAYDIAYPGVELLGSGVDSNGITNNFYNLIGEIATKFENNDLTNIEQYTAKFKEKMNDIVVQYADIGERTRFVDFINSKVQNDEDNAVLKQEKLEIADLAEVITDYMYQKSSYDAALQIGAKILSNTLLDYLR